MLENQRIQTAILSRGGRLQKRSIPLAQGYRMRVTIEKGNHLAIPPHTALVQRRVRHAPFAPQAFQCSGFGSRTLVVGFQQTAASGALVQNLGYRVALSARRFKTNQLSSHAQWVNLQCRAFEL